MTTILTKPTSVSFLILEHLENSSFNKNASFKPAPYWEHKESQNVFNSLCQALSQWWILLLPSQTLTELYCERTLPLFK